jgi:hypothetical protein
MYILYIYSEPIGILAPRIANLSCAGDRVDFGNVIRTIVATFIPVAARSHIILIALAARGNAYRRHGVTGE